MNPARPTTPAATILNPGAQIADPIPPTLTAQLPMANSVIVNIVGIVSDEHYRESAISTGSKRVDREHEIAEQH